MDCSSDRDRLGLALGGLWVLTLTGYLLGPETKGKELEDLADEALAEDLLGLPRGGG